MRLLFVVPVVASYVMLSAFGYNFTFPDVTPPQGPNKENIGAIFAAIGIGADIAARTRGDVPRGKCSVCIERNYDYGGAVNMNFKDIHGESNWNMERFSKGHQIDCTLEGISGSNKLKMVQFFPRDGDSNCICRIDLFCHRSVMNYDNASVILMGDQLVKKWSEKWPKGKAVKAKCPDNCILLSEVKDGLKGMNVLEPAFKCQNDTACIHDNIEMW